MRSVFQTTLRHTLIYGFGTVGYRLAGFILLPLYTAKIPPAQYGVYGVLEVLEQIVVGVFSFGLPTALFKWLALARNRQETSQALSTALWLVVVSNLAALGVLAISLPLGLAQWAASRFPSSGLAADAFLSLGLIFCLDALATATVRLLLNVLRAQEKPGWYTGLSLGRFFVVLGLVALFVGVLDLGIIGIFLGQLVGSAVVLMVLAILLGPHVAFGLRVDWVKPMLRYGAPLALVAVILLLLNMGNRFFVQIFCGSEDLGRFTFGQKIGNIPYVVLVQPFTFAYFPIMWKVKESNPDFMSRALTYFVACGLWVVLGFLLFAREVTLLLARDPAYNAAWVVVPVVALGAVGYGVVYLLQSPFYLSGQTQWIAVGYALGIVVNVLVNVWALPQWGYVAAAWSVPASYAAVSLLSYPIGRRCYRIGYEIRRVLFAAAIAMAVGVAGWALNRGYPGGWVFWKLVLLFSFPLLLLALGFFNDDEMLWVRRRIRRARAFLG